MESPYLSDQSFFQLLSDAIYFARISKESSDQFECQRFARGSVLNSILTIESAANCCLTRAIKPSKFLDEVEKLTSFAKFDLYSCLKDSEPMNRGNHIIQKVVELKKIRDSLVHPKKIKIPVTLSLDEEKYIDLVELGISFEPPIFPATKIAKSSIFWFSSDAEEALKTVFSFYDYYFIETLKMNHKDILGLLGTLLVTSEDSGMLFHIESLDRDLDYIKEFGINQKFIDLSSVRQIDVAPPVAESPS